LSRTTATGYLAQMTAPLPEWKVSKGLVGYAEALAAMEARVEAISRGEAVELVWLLEHPPVITAGTSADEAELLDPARFPVHRAGRGGRFTYHGPGQRVIYVLLDLNARGRDVRRLVAALESWAIASLADLGVRAFTSEAGTGIWVAQTDPSRGGATGERLAKIGAIGVRVRRWVSFHGMAINVSTELDHYTSIIPCGIEEHGVTRLADLRAGAEMGQLDAALLQHFPRFVGDVTGCRKTAIKTLEAGVDCR
jgi:lipoyl(octanoyl) transferase